MLRRCKFEFEGKTISGEPVDFDGPAVATGRHLGGSARRHPLRPDGDGR